MRLLYIGIFLVILVEIKSQNVWLKDLTSPKGLDLGYGVILKLNAEKKGKHVSAFERLSLDLNFGDAVGVSLSKPKSEGVELDLYVKKDTNGQIEGRSKNHNGKNMMKMMIGYKVAVVTSIMFAIMKVMTMKALFLAKAALIISLTVLLLKLKNYQPREIIEVEQHGYPSNTHYVERDPGYGHHGYGGGYYSSHIFGREAQPSNMYNDIVYAPSGPTETSESNAAYSAGMPNGSIIQGVPVFRNDQEIERRKDKLFYKKLKGTAAAGNLLTIKKYAASSET